MSSIASLFTIATKPEKSSWGFSSRGSMRLKPCAHDTGTLGVGLGVPGEITTNEMAGNRNPVSDLWRYLASGMRFRKDTRPVSFRDGAERE